jgi:hypothetical protein
MRPPGVAQDAEAAEPLAGYALFPAPEDLVQQLRRGTGRPSPGERLAEARERDGIRHECPALPLRFEAIRVIGAVEKFQVAAVLCCRQLRVELGRRGSGSRQDVVVRGQGPRRGERQRPS